MAKKIDPSALRAPKRQKKVEVENPKLAQYRKQTTMLLLENPNYFGTHKGKFARRFKPVFELGSQATYYEGLGCIDYYPEHKMLGASIVIKRPTGYGGSPCQGGSKEYVRFYVDYDNSGTWVDEGLAVIGVYNRSFNDPLCYYAKIVLTPDKSNCCNRDPVLPKVRAILSWNIEPTPGDPDFIPVWGEVKESYIQIAPWMSLWCFITETLKVNPKIKKVWPELLEPDFEKKYLPELKNLIKYDKPLALPQPMPDVLKKAYGNKVSDARIAHPYMQTMMAMSYSPETSINLLDLLPNFNIAGILDSIAKSKFNTTFEELRCVSLDRDASTLHASVQVKLSSGYNGNLCTEGSKEHVAFYMDFGSGWEYMGTNFAVVHDIPVMPAGGLWYDVALGVNLDAHRKKWCEAGKAKVRAILSWSTVPAPNDPDYVATWGDWEECNVEIKPLPSGVVPGSGAVVVLEKCGGMIVTDINNAGLATYGSAGSINGAKDSPFYGNIELVGNIFFAGTNPKYKFMLTEPGGVKHPILGPQKITTDSLGVIKEVTLNPDADGWIDYLEKPGVNIVGGLLGSFGAYTEGLYEISIEAQDDFGSIFNPHQPVKIMVDAKAPVVTIDLDPPAAAPGTQGNCADFIIPEIITGTYSMADDHAGSFQIYVTPNNSALVKVDGHDVTGYAYNSMTYPLPNGGTFGTFEIQTKNMIKCGYNVRIDAVDRTIVNSHWVGLGNTALQGFCLRK